MIYIKFFFFIIKTTFKTTNINKKKNIFIIFSTIIKNI